MRGLQDLEGMLGQCRHLNAFAPTKTCSLWSRLILHYWAVEVELDSEKSRTSGQEYEPKPVEYLQKAYELTIKATSKPSRWLGTTTAAGAQLFYKRTNSSPDSPATPVLYVTNLGDSQVLVLRPQNSELIYKTREQWHWFDCPRQLGTNSPDTPAENAVMDKVEIQENDVVLAMSDGVIDNLWEHEIIENVVSSIQKWESGQGGESTGNRQGGAGGGMGFVADELMKAAKAIATDPFAESPFMEHAVEEGLAMEGGKHILECRYCITYLLPQVKWMISVSLLHYAKGVKGETMETTRLRKTK